VSPCSDGSVGAAANAGSGTTIENSYVVGPAVKRTTVCSKTSGNTAPGARKRLEAATGVGHRGGQLPADVGEQPDPLLLSDAQEVAVQVAVVVVEHEVGVAPMVNGCCVMGAVSPQKSMYGFMSSSCLVWSWPRRSRPP
jgi:hypothetical protein